MIYQVSEAAQLNQVGWNEKAQRLTEVNLLSNTGFWRNRVRRGLQRTIQGISCPLYWCVCLVTCLSSPVKTQFPLIWIAAALEMKSSWLTMHLSAWARLQPTLKGVLAKLGIHSGPPTPGWHRAEPPAHALHAHGRISLENPLMHNSTQLRHICVSTSARAPQRYQSLAQPWALLAWGTQQCPGQFPSMVQDSAWSWNSSQGVQPLHFGGRVFSKVCNTRLFRSQSPKIGTVQFNTDAELITVMTSASPLLRMSLLNHYPGKKGLRHPSITS